MSELTSKLTHYRDKCSQHLSRVRLSHALAVQLLESNDFSPDKFADLIQTSGVVSNSELSEKLHVVIHESHFVSLKANFELYLNRSLATSLNSDDAGDVPTSGLNRFKDAIKHAAGIQLPQLLNDHDGHLWPQIFTAFEIRNLVEHCDAKVTATFRAKVRGVWKMTTWGDRLDLEAVESILIPRRSSSRCCTRSDRTSVCPSAGGGALKSEWHL